MNQASPHQPVLASLVDYQEKPAGYFGHARKEVATLFPIGAKRVLEIGCGEGATLLWLKQQYGVEWIAGVELLPSAAQRAEQALDAVWCGNIENLQPAVEPASLDVILCLDVLEHLVDPWTVVDKLAVLLKPGGCLIASIPNIRYRTVVLPLLLHGVFIYQDSGILDRTHLRFFTRQSAIGLLNRRPLIVTDVAKPLPIKPLRGKWFFHLLTANWFRDLDVKQFLIKAERHR